MNIILSIPFLSVYGGIERLVCGLATNLALRGHQVFLFSTETPKTQPVYPLHPSVQIIYHNYDGDKQNLNTFKKLLLSCNPDVCVSLASWNVHLCWAAGLWGTGIPWVYSEHCDPQIVENEIWNRKERLAAMAGADIIHVLRSSSATTLPFFLTSRVQVIPNPLSISPLQRKEEHSRSPRKLLSLGRLDPGKQNEILILAFSLIAAEFPDWYLDIWGDGPEKHKLLHEIKNNSMQNKIYLHGETSAPEKCYSQADIFCMPSRHEGFPNVIIEAMAHALPVVGFAQCAGVNEVIVNEKTGILVTQMTPQCLASALRRLMSDDNLQKTLGKQALIQAQEYAPERIYPLWEQMLVQAAMCKNNTQLHEDTTASFTSEELHHFVILKNCLQRSHLYLKNNNRIRLFIWRHPKLRKFFRGIKLTIHKFIPSTFIK